MNTDQQFGSLARFENVSKWYGHVIAVNNVDLEIGKGITGLVGPNGAGKSTMIRLLTGHLRPSLGRVQICGRSAWSAAAKTYVGYCPDVDSFYEEMTGSAFVSMMGKLHGMVGSELADRTSEVLTIVGMHDRANRKLGSYSKGMRQRIKLAQALIHDPPLIVLDEPLNGIDPVGRAELVDVFRELACAGKSILVSSHILEEMDRVAQRLVFVVGGRRVAAGTLSEVREMLEEFPLQILIGSGDARAIASRLIQESSVRSVVLESEERLIVEVCHASTFYERLTELTVELNWSIQRMVPAGRIH